LTTIISKSSTGKWFRILWESKNNALATETVALETQKGLPRFHIKHEKVDYHMEGIIFVRIWDQRCSFTQDYSDSLEPPIVSRLEQALRSDVLANDLKSLKDPKGWLIESIISNMFVRLRSYFYCPNILVEEVSQVLLDENILVDLGKISPEERDIKMTCPYSDLDTWNKVYTRIDEHLLLSANLKELFEPSRFLFIPINVHKNHWILMVVSSGQKRIFIMDSYLNDGETSSDLYLGAIFMKYLEYKASISDGDFAMDQDWRVESLPVIHQSDHSSCGIHVILNAAKLMRQIKENSQVQLSFVEDPVPKFSKSNVKNLNDYVANIRSLLMNMFLYQESFDNVMTSIFSSIPTHSTSQTPPIVKKKGRKTPPKGSAKDMKVVFLG
jgi:hypothetical protein